MPSIASLLSGDAATSAAGFAAVAALLCVLVYVLTKSVVLASALFCGTAAALLAVSKLRPEWLEGSFAGCMDALALFDRFSTFVNGVFDVTALVYFLSVALLFVFLTCQSFEKRRWN